MLAATGMHRLTHAAILFWPTHGFLGPIFRECGDFDDAWIYQPRVARRRPNQSMKLSWRGGHLWRNESVLSVAAPARTLCAIR